MLQRALEKISPMKGIGLCLPFSGISPVYGWHVLASTVMDLIPNSESEIPTRYMMYKKIITDETSNIDSKTENFCQKYCLRMSQTKAAMEAGYSSVRASVTGSELIKMESKIRLRRY